MSLTDFETLHQLCELERTQILQSLALAVLKIPYAGYLLSGNRSIFFYYEGDILWYYTCTKKYHSYMFLKTKDAIKESQYCTKTKYILLIYGKKYRPQDISTINIFIFVNLKNELLAFLGWPYYILEY